MIKSQYTSDSAESSPSDKHQELRKGVAKLSDAGRGRVSTAAKSSKSGARAAEREAFAAARGYAAVPVAALRADLCGRLREARRMERVNRKLGNQDWADQWLGETYVLDRVRRCGFTGQITKNQKPKYDRRRTN